MAPQPCALTAAEGAGSPLIAHPHCPQPPPFPLCPVQRAQWRRSLTFCALTAAQGAGSPLIAHPHYPQPPHCPYALCFDSFVSTMAPPLRILCLHGSSRGSITYITLDCSPSLPPPPPLPPMPCSESTRAPQPHILCLHSSRRGNITLDTAPSPLPSMPCSEGTMALQTNAFGDMGVAGCAHICCILVLTTLTAERSCKDHVPFGRGHVWRNQVQVQGPGNQVFCEAAEVKQTHDGRVARVRSNLLHPPSAVCLISAAS